MSLLPAELNEKYGPGTLIPLAHQPYIQRLPTGVFALDLALGGGWPFGRVSMVWGAWSAGKTNLTAFAITQAQRRCRYDGLLLGDPGAPGRSQLSLQPTIVDTKTGEVVFLADVEAAGEILTFYDIGKDDDGNEIRDLKDNFELPRYQTPMRTLIANAEGALDSAWVTQIGVDPNLTYVLNIETAEATIDIIEASIRKDFADLIIVDSIAAMTPDEELEKSAEGAIVGTHAKLINRAMRVWIAAMHERRDSVKPTILLVNQIRQKIGAKKYESPDVKPGGYGQLFTTTCDVKLSHGKRDATDFAPKDQGGHQMLARTNFRVEKNKTFPPKGYGQYITTLSPHDEWEPGQVIQLHDVITTAKQYGVIRKEKSKWVLGGAIKFNTLKAIGEWARKNPDDFDDFRAELVRQIVEMRAGHKRLTA